MPVIVQQRSTHVVMLDKQTMAKLASPGPQGATGNTGAPGAGAGTDFPQSSALQWTINHNLGYRPSVELIDSAGNEFDAEIRHLSANTVQVTMLVATAGTARLS